MKYTSKNPNGINQIASSSVAISVLNTDVAVFTTSSFILGGALTSSNALITGNVVVLGTASINTLIVNQTKYSSGSNQLGDGIEDTQTFFGTVRIPTGSFTVTGSSIMSGSLNVTGGITGSLFGIATTASFVNPLVQNVFVTGALNLQTPSSPSTRERILTAGVSDAPGDLFFINNGTIGDGNFFPVFGGIVGTVTNSWALGFNGFTTAANDTDSSNYGLIDFAALKTTNATDPLNGTLSNVSNRKLFTFRGLTNNNYLTIVANGNILINTATDSGFKLDVNGTGRFSGNVQITGSATNSLLVKGSGTTSATTALRIENANASASLEILDNGVLRNYNNGSPYPVLETYIDGISSGIKLTRQTDGFVGRIFWNANYNFPDNGGRVTFGATSDGIAHNGGGALNLRSVQPQITLMSNSNSGRGSYVIAPTASNSFELWLHDNFNQQNKRLTLGFANNGDLTYYQSGSLVPLLFVSQSGQTIISGSLTVTTGSLIEFQVTNTGVKIGNATTDIHPITGSVFVSSSFSTSSAAFNVYKSGSTVLDIQGSQGQLFSVVDSLTGSLMSVNDVSGLPILEVFSNDTVVMGTYGNPALIISGSVANVTGSLVTQGQTIDPALIWFMS